MTNARARPLAEPRVADETRTHAIRDAVSRLRRKTPRWAKIALAVVVAVYVLYLVVANVILGTGLLRSWINTDEQRLRVEYASAWSPWPGHVVARDLSIRLQDDNVQFLLEIERVSFDTDSFALARRTFRVRRLRADGTSFRFRHKLESTEGNEGRLAAYPKIEGFADPPVRHEVEKPPIPDDQYRLWSVELADVSASLRELWVMEYRYRGRGSVAGGFRLKPQRELHVSPSVVLTDGGVLAIGESDVLVRSHGRIEAEVETFDLRDAKGLMPLKHLSGRVVLDGDVASIAPLGAVYIPDRSVEIDRGAGRLSISAHVDHGVLEPDTRVSYEARDAIVRTRSAAFAGDARIEGRIDGSGPSRSLAADMTSREIGLTPAKTKDAKAPAAMLADVRAGVDLGNADLTAPFGLASLSLGIGSAKVKDLRAMQPLAPKDLSLEGGSVTAALSARYDRGALEARAAVGLDRATFTAGPVRSSATGRIWATASASDVKKAIALPSLGAHLRDVDLKVKDATTDGIHVDARVDGASIGTSDESAKGTLVLDAGPGDRTLRLVTRLASLPDQAADAASASSDLHAVVHGAKRGSNASVTLESAENGAVGARGTLNKTKGRTSGAFLLRVGPVNAGIEIRDDGVKVTPFVRSDWLDGRSRS